MLYQLHELTRNLLAPWVHQAQANAHFFNNAGHWHFHYSKTQGIMTMRG